MDNKRNIKPKLIKRESKANKINNIQANQMNNNDINNNKLLNKKIMNVNNNKLNKIKKDLVI